MHVNLERSSRQDLEVQSTWQNHLTFSILTRLPCQYSINGRAFHFLYIIELLTFNGFVASDSIMNFCKSVSFCRTSCCNSNALLIPNSTCQAFPSNTWNKSSQTRLQSLAHTTHSIHTHKLWCCMCCCQ